MGLNFYDNTMISSQKLVVRINLLHMVYSLTELTPTYRPNSQINCLENLKDTTLHPISTGYGVFKGGIQN